MPRLNALSVRWLAILVVALGVRAGGAVWWQYRMTPNQQFYFGDSLSYWVLGGTIARGEPYQYLTPEYRVFRMPGYPLLLAGLFRTWGDGSILAARMLSVALGTAAVGLVGLWGTELFGSRAGLYAGWLAALYPGAIAASAFVLSEAPFFPCMLAQLILWSIAWRKQNTRQAVVWGLLAGVASAAATYMRPGWLFFTPFGLSIGLVTDRPRGRHLSVALAMCLGLVVCMAPWWIRNAQLTGHFVSTTLQVGASLYDGLNPAADGSSNFDAIAPIADEERQAHKADGSSEDFEYRLDRRLVREALDWARQNPGPAVALGWTKFERTWNVWPNEPAFRGWPLRLAVAATYTPLLCLGLWGAWKFSKCGFPYVLAWLPAVYLALLHTVFVGSLRYREPAMLALTVLAAGVLAGALPTGSREEQAHR